MTEEEKLIPPGPYCYMLDVTREHEYQPEMGIPVVHCPHYRHKEFNGVNVPWCNFINKGGCGNETDEEFAKLAEYFGSEDNVFDFLSLDLLFDQCKCCGMGGDYRYSDQDVLDWIKLAKDYENRTTKPIS
jgi:hypothetical protein